MGELIAWPKMCRRMNVLLSICVLIVIVKVRIVPKIAVFTYTIYFTRPCLPPLWDGRSCCLVSAFNVQVSSLEMNCSTRSRWETLWCHRLKWYHCTQSSHSQIHSPG